MIDNARRENHNTRVRSRRRGLSLATCILSLAVLVCAAISGLQAQQVPQQPPPLTANLQPGPSSIPGPPVFEIDPKLPAKDLLPSAPKVEKIRPLTSYDLTQVPEVQLQIPLKKDNPLQETGFLLAKINHLNRKDRDGFLKALVAERQDLAGLPFAMGDACRTKGERNRQFAQAVETVRVAMGQQLPQVPQASFAPIAPLLHQDAPLVAPAPPVIAPPPPVLTVPAPSPAPDLTQPRFSSISVEIQANTPAAGFWTRYQALCDQQDSAQARVDKEQCDHITVARIAALMQILSPESPSLRLGLVKHLSSIPHIEATRALARLALFSAEDEVRLAAVAALEVRRERDYTDILVKGLRYPWPKVAGNAADAIVRLKRTDLVPQLVAVLEEPDPRAPVVQEIGTKKVTVVNEMVRINHHRNCAMCHSPGNTGEVPGDTLTAGVPLPNEPLSGLSGGYNRSRPDVLVRIDVTYLRQDFSMMQSVADANPWPELQRFDFLVRTRLLNAEEIAVYQEQFGKNDPTRPSPYQKAALAALREITGRDTAPTGEAWRKLLDLPARNLGKGLKDINAAGPLAQLR